MPKISVIIATYQRANYLKFALESIFNQSYRDYEVIVVDDGSTDDTKAVVSSFDRCCYYYQENRGVSVAKNRGVDLSSGEYISFLDSDDMWDSEKLQKQLDVFTNSPEVELVFTHGKQFISKEISETDKGKLYCPEESMPAPISSTLLALKSVFQQVGGFDENLSVGIDVDWYLRAKALNCKIEMIPETLFYRRIHKTNSGFLNKNKKQQHVQVVKAHLERLRKTRNLEN
jgi:glycosyltransferase involved in cell wall biosynthesis